MKTHLIFVIALTVSLEGCKQNPPPPTPSPVVSSSFGGGAAPPTTAEGKASVSISGKVVWKGTPPVLKTIAVTSDPTCAALHPNGISGESLVVDPNGGIQNVLVYIKSGLGERKFSPPAVSLLLDQKGCQYLPHVIAVQTGQELNIRNSDSTLHNVNGMATVNSPWNIGQPTPGMTLAKKFSKPEIIKVICSVHPWMNAYIGVFDHPFVVVTGKDGVFSLPLLPAGQYEVEAWQEKLGVTTQKITVSEGEKKEVLFEFEAK